MTSEQARGGAFNIVLASDEMYLRAVKPLVRSIRACNAHHNITFHLLYDGAARKLTPLRRFFAQFPNYELKTYGKDLSGIKYRNVYSFITRATMLRLYAPEILSDINGKILYLDLDLAVYADLQKVFELDAPRAGVTAKSSLKPNLMNQWLEKCGSSARYPHSRSFNAGVLLIDLDKARANAFTDKIMALWKKHPECNDQILLNFYCDGVYGELPPQYNVFNTQDDELVKRHQGDFIIHFIGSKKPWNWYTCPNKRLWLVYCDNVARVNARSFFLTALQVMRYRFAVIKNATRDYLRGKYRARRNANSS